jgi:hypothetical protein
MRSKDDPRPLTEPERVASDDDIGEADSEAGERRHDGPSDDATADIEERQGGSHRPGKGRPPEDAPTY